MLAGAETCVRVCQGQEEKQKDLQLWCFGCVAEGPGVILTPSVAPFPVFLIVISLDRRGVSSIRYILCSAKSSSVSREIRTCRLSVGCLDFCSGNECVDNV